MQAINLAVSTYHGPQSFDLVPVLSNLDNAIEPYSRSLHNAHYDADLIKYLLTYWALASRLIGGRLYINNPRFGNWHYHYEQTGQTPPVFGFESKKCVIQPPNRHCSAVTIEPTITTNRLSAVYAQLLQYYQALAQQRPPGLFDSKIQETLDVNYRISVKYLDQTPLIEFRQSFHRTAPKFGFWHDVNQSIRDSLAAAQQSLDSAFRPLGPIFAIGAFFAAIYLLDRDDQ